MRLPTLTIGQVARITTVSAKALRHYEALGLLPGIVRVGSYRHYSDEHVLAIRLIRQAQDLGFTLAELRALVREDGCTPDWDAFVLAIETKRQRIQVEIEQLRQREAALVELARTLPGLMAQSDNCDAIASRLVKA